MAAPKIRIKRPAAVMAAEEPVPTPQEEEPEVVEEVTQDTGNDPELEEDESPYEALSIDELRAELTSRGLDATGRRSVMVERLEEDDAKPVAKPAPKPVVKPVTKAAPAPAPKPVVKPAPTPTPKPVAKPAPVAASKPVAVAPKPVSVPPKVAPTPIPQKAVETSADDGASSVANMTVKEIFDIMKAGQSLILVKEDKNVLTMSLVDTEAVAKTQAVAKAATPTPKLRGEAYWREVLSEAYYAWYYEDAGTGKAWSDMSAEEKQAFVDSLGIEYETHEDARVNALHQVTALLKHLDIQKYKPEYESSAARDALKG